MTYMRNPQIVDVSHGLTMAQIGIEAKIYDADFLEAISSLIGSTTSLSKHLVEAILLDPQSQTRFVPYILAGLKYNLGGTNAAGKVQKDQNITASIALLETFSEKLLQLDKSAGNSNYARLVGVRCESEVMEGLQVLKSEKSGVSLVLQRSGAKCLRSWQNLASSVPAQRSSSAQPNRTAPLTQP